jgi:hypothetical protein
MSNDPTDQSLFAVPVKAIAGIAALPNDAPAWLMLFGKLARLPIW